MPRRFRSVRGRRDETKDIVINPPEYFDFDFRIGSEQNTSAHAVASILPSPISWKAKLKESDPDARPWTSDGKRAADKKLQLTKVDESWIGLAIGSPTHPPDGWNFGPLVAPEQQAISPDGTNSPQSPSKWQQIGGLFKSKSIANRRQTPAQETQVNRVKQDDIIDQPRNLRDQQNKSVATHPLQALDVQSRTTEPSNYDSPGPPAAVTILPKLELDIPNLQFERYSIMFRGLTDVFPSADRQIDRTSAIKPERHGDVVKANIPQLSFAMNIESLDPASHIHPSGPSSIAPPTKINYVPQITSDPDRHQTPLSEVTVSVQKPRSTTSSSIERADAQIPFSHSAKPVNPDAKTTYLESNVLSGTGNKKPSRFVRSTDRSLERPLTSTRKKIQDKNQPSRVEQGTASTPGKPQPLHPRKRSSGEFASSPEESSVQQARGDAPWITSESPRSTASSRTSVGDDIFFDIKPLRDSNGTQDSQYIVTNPDPSAVQLARSISQKIKDKNRQDAFDGSPTPKLSGEPWTMPPDVQAAEHFCAGTDPKSAQYALRMSMFDRAIEEVEKFSPAAQDIPPLPTIKIADHGKPHLNIPLRPQGLAIGIPSPIVERSCESTPSTTPSHEKRPTDATGRRHIAGQTSPLNAGAVDPEAEKPPPVPKKDKKFLPRSKFAIEYETKQSTDQHNIKPRAPLRVATDPVSRPPQMIPIARKRSTTLPTTNDAGNLTHHSRKKIETGIVAVAVKPAAEVSIARTVSLSRKASREITVAHPSSKREDRTTTTERREDFERMNRTRALSPVISQGEKGHKPGASVNAVVEDA